MRRAHQFIVVASLSAFITAGCGVGSQAPDAPESARRMPSATSATSMAESMPGANYEMSKRGAAGADPAAMQGYGAPADADFNTETYDAIVENDFLAAQTNPTSTLSIDVDTASYANVRRFLTHGQLPPAGAVRIEELVNYFDYDYPCPEGDVPFAVNAEIASCPWAPRHRLVRFGLKGREVAQDSRPVSNLVFLLDVSGSMADGNKLPLVKEALRMLVGELGENDRVAIVVYAGSSGLVLPSTTAGQKAVILTALENLHAGGSTNGGAGIQLAYSTAVENFVGGGVNRVILCTDGDFNVGVTSQSQLVSLIEEKAAAGVFLSVLGFGMRNYKDSTMEKLADKGNGNYAYIDSAAEARKVLVEQLTGTLITIAKDVKIQVEFNPRTVAAYRLIGYENRLLKTEDFDDDTKDAGEIGAGHTVTALYEVIPIGVDVPRSAEVRPLKYQQPRELSDSAMTDEMFTLWLTYKEPESNSSEGNKMAFPVRDPGAHFGEATDDFQFAAAVASFGMLLRDSEYKGNATYAAVAEWAQAAQGEDRSGYRGEFLNLVAAAEGLRR